MKNKFKINVLMFIFIFLCTSVLINDYFSYFLNLNYYVGLSISTLITGGIYFLIRKKINIVKEDISKVDIIFYLLLFGMMVITIVFPDRMYDSLNYHIYSQERPFNLISSGDFLPSSDINSYTYSFPDRVFYIFRLIFGYRLGMIFNYLCLIIIYYQVKKILKQIGIKNELLLVVISVLSIFNLSIIDLVDVYYTDYFSIIFSLEIVKIIFEKLDKNTVKHYMFYVALLFGMLFCVKVSNAFFIILFALLLVIKNFKLLKEVKIYNYLILILLFVFPFLSYMLYTYIETGNPVFPFYNTIFKSSLYPLRDWMDTRFGPKSLVETLIWPIKMLFEKQRASDTLIIEPIWAFGYIASILYFIYYSIRIILKKNYNKKKFLLVIITILSYLLWSKFVLGYTRYALFILILSTALFIISIYDSIKYKKYIYLTGALLISTYHIYYSYDNYVKKPQYFSFNNIFGNGLKSYKYNLKYLFAHDIDDVKFPDNSVWGVSNANSAFMFLLNEDIPMYSLRLEKDNVNAKKMQEERLENVDNIYTILESMELPGHFRNLNNWGYKIESVYRIDTPSFVNYNNYLYIFRVEKADEKDPNKLEYSRIKGVDLSLGNHVSFIAGPDIKSKNDIQDGYSIAILGYKDDEYTVIEKHEISKEGELSEFDSELDDSFDSVLIRTIDKNDKIVDNIDIILINYEVD